MSSGAYQLCLQEASTRGRTMIRNLVLRAREEMRLQGGRVIESMAQLDRHEHTLIERFPSHLLAEFTRAMSATPASPPALSPVGSATLKFDELELMDEEQVEEQVEVARALQAARNAVEAIQPELDALMSSLLGLRSTQPERNPMRPDVYVRALQAAVIDTQVNNRIRMDWLLHMGDVLGRELNEAYGDLVARLRAQGVRPADFTVRAIGTEPVSSHGAGASGAAAVPAQGGPALLAPDLVLPPLAGSPMAALGPGFAQAAAAEGNRANGEQAVTLTVAQLRRLLSGELDPGMPTGGPSIAPASAPAPLPAFDYTVPAALEALEEMKQVDRAVDRLKRRQTRTSRGEAFSESALASSFGSPESAELRRRLRQDAKGVGQALGIEVVTLMLEAIARDQRLLEPVRTVIRSLETALMRLALIDPRFFSDKTHPARRLLDEVAQRGMAFESAQSEPFRHFIDPVAVVFQQLVAMDIDGPEAFQAALDELHDIWAEEERLAQARREEAVAALLHVEQRNMLAEKVAHEVRRQLGDRPLEPEIKRFLFGPWSQVIAEARLRDGSGAADPQGAMAFVTDLVWSAQPDVAGRHKGRLTRLIPTLLMRLRDGLKTIDFSASSINSFLRELMKLHQEALKYERPTDAARTRRELEAQFADDSGDDVQEEQHWIGPREARASGFMDLPLDQRPTEPMTVPEATHETGAIEDGLALGSWIEVRRSNRWVRAQLVWASPHRTLFMFSVAGDEPVSMTRRNLQRLRQEGAVRVVSDIALVDSALNAVAQQALRNSVDDAQAGKSR